MGRRNYLGMHALRGAKTSATLYRKSLMPAGVGHALARLLVQLLCFFLLLPRGARKKEAGGVILPVTVRLQLSHFLRRKAQLLQARTTGEGQFKTVAAQAVPFLYLNNIPPFF
jgi:hypothetical protein